MRTTSKIATSARPLPVVPGQIFVDLKESIEWVVNEIDLSPDGVAFVTLIESLRHKPQLQRERGLSLRDTRQKLAQGILKIKQDIPRLEHSCPMPGSVAFDLQTESGFFRTYSVARKPSGELVVELRGICGRRFGGYYTLAEYTRLVHDLGLKVLPNIDELAAYTA